MPEVSVDINGRKYRLACEEGQEQHLNDLAAKFHERVESFKGSFGEIGDNRLTIMAGLGVMDSLAEAEARIANLQDELDSLKIAGAAMAAEAEKFETRVAQRMIDAAGQIEDVAGVLESVGHD